MNKKDRKRKIFEEIRADQAAYDERTRLLRDRIEALGGSVDEAGYDERTRQLKDRIEHYRAKEEEGRRRASS